GKGLTQGLLAGRIASHCAAHGLAEPDRAASEVSWPDFPALRHGWGRDWSWHAVQEERRTGYG
ncbi:MAG: hypothetical protein WBA35_05745, partial [Litorimonas sp.]